MRRLIINILSIVLIFLSGCSRPEKLIKGKFVFTSTRREAPGVYLMRDGKIKLIGKGLECPTWSNDGKYIAASNQKNTIFIFDEYGKEIDKILGLNEPLHLSWSPNNKKIAYAGVGQGEHRVKGKPPIKSKYIYNYNLENNTNTKVYEGDDGDNLMNVGFSPQGDRLVFRSQRWDGKQGIFTINIDGTNLKRISKYGTNPCWFSDGKYIFIVAGQKDNDSYYYTTPTGAHKASYFKVDADTGEVIEELMHEPVAVGFTPRLTRDGKYVITDKQIGGGRAIVIIPLIGKYKHQNIPIYPKEEFGYDLYPDWFISK